MPIRPLIIAAPFLALAACSAQQQVAPPTPLDEAAIRERSAPVAQAFQVALQSQLVAAMSEGGPMQAVEVCHEAAPRIAAEQSAASGAEVRRVSDRNRNPDGGLTPDLAPHYAELAAQPLVDGAPATRIWQSGEGEGARINYLSAIPMRDQPCAACHGSDIDPQLKARIDALYPQDAATGFAAGELRGALLVSWPAEG
ncbi:c-type heme family protein [Alteraurantiacibacter aquimixticola]|uniref:DUF3365 domain-containing protein n=1 Tax=Alteraurantiacibacter aquimixticola TaxID=2489173 RepID=A0A4T3EYN5_9SPHN|nr:DUF3365 domain-containing protein [Alteraurantiacibacter aquimixticola]TIX49746.1 DUF3365 domain-containing protein [Alteraurantiacibacter aquimixticola]